MIIVRVYILPILTSSAHSNTFKLCKRLATHTFLLWLEFVTHNKSPARRHRSLKHSFKLKYLKVDSIETGCFIIVHLLSCSDEENCWYTALFKLLRIRFYRHYLKIQILLFCLYERRISQ